VRRGWGLRTAATVAEGNTLQYCTYISPSGGVLEQLGPKKGAACVGVALISVKVALGALIISVEMGVISVSMG